MGRTSFSALDCPIARTLDAVGDCWTLLVVRDLAFGISRFDAIQGSLGVSRKVLSQRLSTLVEQEIAERVPYQDNPPRYDYRLTEKGIDLCKVLLAMRAWDERWTRSPAEVPA